ncbi:MAG: HAD family phosphatase [Candidatus Pacearchaeota archaeon]
MEQEIKAVIFDMNGVLSLDVELKPGSSLSKSFHNLMAKSLKIDLDKWVDSIDRVYERSIEGKVSEKKTLNTIAKNLGMEPKKIERIIVKNYKKTFKNNKELYTYAFKLKKRGYKIAILSDQWHFSKKALLDKKKADKFDAVIVSCDVGIRKPDPKIYNLALKKLKVKPSEAVFIDNRDWNTKPAEKLGIKTILFKNNEQTFRELEKILKDSRNIK